jgi:hypothetical protein
MMKAPKRSELNRLRQSQFLTITMKHHSACNEAGLSATAIATNALVKDFLCHITASKVNKVAPRGN